MASYFVKNGPTLATYDSFHSQLFSIILTELEVSHLRLLDDMKFDKKCFIFSVKFIITHRDKRNDSCCTYFAVTVLFTRRCQC